MKQYTTADRNAETGAFEQGSRFLFSCDEDGYVSTVGLSDSTATMTLESYIDLDFSNLILGEARARLRISSWAITRWRDSLARMFISHSTAKITMRSIPTGSLQIPAMNLSS